MSLGLDEEKAKASEEERAVDAHVKALRLIWLAILVSVVVLFFVSRLLRPEPAAPSVIFWILLAVGAGNLGASFVLKQKLLKKAAETRNPNLVRSAYIVALALCESLALFGLIVHLATGAEYYYFLFVLSGFGILLHKPQRDDVLAAFAGAPVWGVRNKR